MAYWLLKSEPDVFSIDDLAKLKVTGWEGVRNYEARNFMLKMKKGDRAFFYHSNADPSAIVGEVEVVKEAYPDPAQFNLRSPHYDPKSPHERPTWWQVDVRFLRKYPRPLPLDDLRKEPKLKGMALVRRGRLSVTPVARDEWWLILSRCG